MVVDPKQVEDKAWKRRRETVVWQISSGIDGDSNASTDTCRLDGPVLPRRIVIPLRIRPVLPRQTVMP
jgi:hypothetical protein